MFDFLLPFRHPLSLSRLPDGLAASVLRSQSRGKGWIPSQGSWSYHYDAPVTSKDCLSELVPRQDSAPVSNPPQ